LNLPHNKRMQAELHRWCEH